MKFGFDKNNNIFRNEKVRVEFKRNVFVRDFDKRNGNYYLYVISAALCERMYDDEWWWWYV